MPNATCASVHLTYAFVNQCRTSSMTTSRRTWLRSGRPRRCCWCQMMHLRIAAWQPLGLLRTSMDSMELNRIIRCNLPQLNQLEFYHPNVDQVSLSPNSSFFRSCSLGGTQCGLHHGVLREWWLLCAQHEVAQDGALSLLGPRYAIHTKSRDRKDLGLGLQSGAACHIEVFLFSHFGKFPDLESVYAWTVASLCFFAFTFSIISLSGASGILSGILDTIF